MSPYPVLRGSFAITGDGYSAAGKPQAISYWNWDHAPLLFGQNNGIAMPTLLDRTDTAQWDHPHLGDSHRSMYIDQSVLAQTIFNNWSSNSANGVGVDWVITYFTKYLWRDALGFYGDAAPYEWPAVAAGDGDFATMQGRLAYDMLGANAAASASPWTTAIGTPSATGGSENGGRCIRISLASGNPFGPRGPEPPLAAIFDREEDTNELTGGISPGPATNSYDLCDEANVVSITHGARKPVLRDAGAVVINASTLNLPFGWAVMDTRGLDTPPFAVAGFSYTLRDLGDPTQALGSIVPHDFYTDFVGE